MLRSILFGLAGAAVFGASALAQETPARPNTPEGWRALALSDLDAARETLRSQTPIPYDTENSSYPAWLEEGYERARALAGNAQDAAGHFYAIAFYLNGFNDPHIDASPVGELPAPRWPGFVAASRNGGAMVTFRDEADADAPPVGAQILSCEDKSLAALAEERLYPYVLNGRLAFDRRRAVTRLFLERGIPGAPAPSRCLILHDGQQREITLRWRALPEPADAYWSAYQAGSAGPAAPWGVSEPAPGVFWIGIPTFSSGGDTAPQLEALAQAIEARGAEMRTARAIVIDVRGNGGGNSAWADRIAAGIFGERLARRARNASSGRSATDWRASPENVAYWENWIETVGIPEFGANSEGVRQLRGVVRGLSRAVDRDPPIWRQGWRFVPRGGGLTQRRPQGDSPFPARVYMLSNGTCGSSCLNFADTVLFVPGVKLIGSATSGDGPYMEVREVTLPSGLVTLTIPQKVWRGMGRGSLEAYEPDVAYDGAWDDASVRAWVMELIAAQ
jgi:hypothetical protein